MKTVQFKPKPADLEDWVQEGSRPIDREARRPATEPAPAPAEPMKRFTIDVPLTLHTRIKIECARRGLKMADAIRELLEREFAKS